MATDDLDAPLGQERQRRSGDASRLPVAHSAGDRRAARPVRRGLRRLGAGRRRSARRRADRRSRPAIPPKSRHAGRGEPAPAPAANKHRRPDAAAPGSRPPAGPATPITIIDGRTGKRQEVPIAAPQGGKARARRAAPARSLAPRRHSQDRAGRHAPGRRLCPRRQAGRGQADGPRIAIVIGGLGVSATATQPAHTKLPGAGDVRFRALRLRARPRWWRARATTATKCCCRCRWSRSTIPTTIPARRRC